MTSKTRSPSFFLALALSSLFGALWGCDGAVRCNDGLGPSPTAICAPRAAPVNTALTLRAQDGCGGCNYHATACEVSLSGSVLTLRMMGQFCTQPSDIACLAVCSIDEVSCETPPLPAGEYTVQGLATGTSTAPRTITVSSTGTAIDCAL